VAHLRECLIGLRETRQWIGIPDRLDTLARVTARLGRPDRAARMLGAAEALREVMGMRAFARSADYQRTDYEDVLAATRAALGDEAFASAWAEGRMMTVEDAVAYALANAAVDEKPRT
jgi:hypothetical protein